MKPQLTGNDLKALGLRPGPVFGRILESLRDARLDGEVSSEDGERHLAAQLVQSLKAEEEG